MFLASKFAIRLPYIPLQTLLEHDGVVSEYHVFPDHKVAKTPFPQRENENQAKPNVVKYRDEAAAPPTYLLFLLYVPLGVAIFITGSRYFNYRHHGFDLISGTVIGITTAWFSFRWYHLPVGRGAGWSWGPRSSRRAFWVGFGSRGYVDEENRTTSGVVDVEMGNLSREHGATHVRATSLSSLMHSQEATGASVQETAQTV